MLIKAKDEGTGSPSAGDVWGDVLVEVDVEGGTLVLRKKNTPTFSSP